MINFKELRIGNWVFSKTDKTKIQMKSFFGLCNIESNPDLFEPIPLTEEWLMKFGFDEKEPVLISSWKFSPFCETIITKCEHVHQLQNLYFALTGEELVVSDAVS
jgi:hypothetical protein